MARSSLCLKSVFLVLLLFLAACSGSDSSPGKLGFVDGEPEVESGERATGWSELAYGFSAAGSREGCAYSEVKIDEKFRYTYRDCKREKSGWVKQSKISNLKRVAKSALEVTASRLRCSRLGLKPTMTLEIQNKTGGNRIVIREFKDQADCVRGSSEASEGLNDFMSELLFQLGHS